MRLITSSLIAAVWISCVLGCAQKKEHNVDWFKGKDLLLQQAIDTDDVEKLHTHSADYRWSGIRRGTIGS